MNNPEVPRALKQPYCMESWAPQEGAGGAPVNSMKKPTDLEQLPSTQPGEQPPMPKAVAALDDNF